MNVQVLAVLPGRMAVVSTNGFVRAVDPDTREVIEELVPEDTAQLYCEQYRAAGGRALVPRHYSSPSSALKASLSRGAKRISRFLSTCR